MANKLIEAAAESQKLQPILERDRKIAKLTGELHEAQKKYKNAMEELARAEQVNEFVAAMSEQRDPQAWEHELKAGSAKACAIVCASDWHLEEPVDPKTINNLNEFDLHEARRRVHKFFDKIPQYIDRYVPMAKQLWLWAGGDFISGYIHPELTELNQLSPTEASMLWLELWSDGIATLRKKMPKLSIIIPTSFDNHGRTTEKMRVASAASNSFTQLMYWVAERYWRNDPKVTWRIGDGYHNIQNIMGRKVRFHHGHALKFNGGVGGITIPVRKAIAQWNKSQRVDLDVFGHWHEYMDGGHFIANGPLIGYGAYSLQVKAEWQPPTQTFLVFDKKFGLRQSTRIFVGDR
jgi:hypothetical protein